MIRSCKLKYNTTPAALFCGTIVTSLYNHITVTLHEFGYNIIIGTGSLCSKDIQSFGVCLNKIISFHY